MICSGKIYSQKGICEKDAESTSKKIGGKKMSDKGLSMLGLATKAGKTVSGEFSVEKAVKENRAYLVIVAEEASDNTKKKFTNMCTFYKVPLFFYGNKDTLGSATGKITRTSVAVTDEGFATAIQKKITE